MKIREFPLVKREESMRLFELGQIHSNLVKVYKRLAPLASAVAKLDLLFDDLTRCVENARADKVDSLQVSCQVLTWC